MKRSITQFAIMASTLFIGHSAQSQAITEGFDDITTLAGSGWAMTNSSTPIGLITNWFQGTDIAGGGPFNSYNGATNSYIAANYNFVSGNNTISGWLMTPNRTFKNGDVITFYTRKPSPDTYADRLEVRLSTNGASTNVGTGSTAVGDFTTQLMTVNPALTLGVYPTVWTQYTITISGLTAPTSGRVAFRYFVTSGGPSGANSDYIGIDNFVYTPYVCPAFTMTTAGSLTGGTAGSAYTETLTQTGALGAPTFSVTGGSLPSGLTLAANGTISGTPTVTGTFNFTVTVSDASGCTGTESYSIDVVCPPNPTSLNGLPALCSNDGFYTLTEGMPAGGTYSGTGVSGGSFDVSNGTQLITYDYTDTYGCAHSSSATLTVNTAPTVSLSPFSEVCADAGAITLSGGLPAGGTYGGGGVSAGTFDPSGGTQMITYTYTDGNGCSDAASENFPVNPVPTVTLAPFTAVCENGGTVSLAGGAPAGGTYSGTGVSGTTFDPASGTQTITYDYTDGNGCSNSAMEVFTVNPAPTVGLTLPVTEVCVTAAAITLSGGTPTGGVYSGNGVAGGSFDPGTAGVGAHVVTYAYTDGNGCTDESTASIAVGDCAGLEEYEAMALTVFPNPSTGMFTIQAEGVLTTDQLVVSDMSGRTVKAIVSTSPDGWEVDLTAAPEGIYFVSGSVSGRTFRLKLEKIH